MAMGYGKVAQKIDGAPREKEDFMQVRIEKLDGSSGPLQITLEAESDDEMKALSQLGKIPMAAVFEIRQWQGASSDESVWKVTLQQAQKAD